jgi:hypothetical protein
MADQTRRAVVGAHAVVAVVVRDAPWARGGARVRLG